MSGQSCQGKKMPDEITEISLENISELQPVDCTNKDIHLGDVDNPVFKQQSVRISLTVNGEKQNKILCKTAILKN